MKTRKQLTKTELIELVETHNLAISLKRLNAAPYDCYRWRRALYHALAMVDDENRGRLEKIRQALELP